jgi:hypothetical protein
VPANLVYALLISAARSKKQANTTAVNPAPMVTLLEVKAVVIPAAIATLDRGTVLENSVLIAFKLAESRISVGNRDAIELPSNASAKLD